MDTIFGISTGNSHDFRTPTGRAAGRAAGRCSAECRVVGRCALPCRRSPAVRNHAARSSTLQTPGQVEINIADDHACCVRKHIVVLAALRDRVVCAWALGGCLKTASEHALSHAALCSRAPIPYSAWGHVRSIVTRRSFLEDPLLRTDVAMAATALGPPCCLDGEF